MSSVEQASGRAMSPDTGGRGGVPDLDVRNGTQWKNIETAVNDGRLTADRIIEGARRDIVGRVGKYRESPSSFGDRVDDAGQILLRLTGNGRYVDEWLEARQPGSGEDVKRKVMRAYGRLEKEAVGRGFAEERANRRGVLEGEVKCSFCGEAISGLMGEGGKCIHCAATVSREEANYVDVDLSGVRRYVSDVRIRDYSSDLRSLARDANSATSLETPQERAEVLRGVIKELREFRRDANTAQYADLDSTLYRAMRDNLRLAKGVGNRGSTVDGGVVAGKVEEVQKLEVPTTEKELRLFLRKKIREEIGKRTIAEALTPEAVMDKVAMAAAGTVVFTPGMKLIDLYPKELGSRREAVKALVEEEVKARCLLHLAELQEQDYKNMADKGAAVKRYIGDMKGSETGSPKAVVINRETFLWLKNLENLEDGLTTERVDQAFQLLVLLGENDVDNALPDNLSRFQRYIGVIPNGEKKTKNFYDPTKYPIDLRDQAFKEMGEMFGVDAVTLAWQMFQAFKEEGNYNWQHYMSRLFTFGANRHALATLLDPPVYTGSRRVYMKEERETFQDEYYIDEKGKRKRQDYRDQLKRLALSPLRIRVKTESVEVEEEGEPKSKDVKVKDVYFDRAKQGRFLEDTPFESRNFVAYVPQQESYLTIKDGNEMRDKIAAIGELGQTEDKGAKVGEAVGLLADIRKLGVSMAMESEMLGGYGVFTVEELNRQVVLEARNIFWEMGVENPVNTRDLNRQERTKPKFLVPSQLNVLLERLGGVVGDNYRIIGSDEDYRLLEGYVKLLRKRVIDLIMSGRMQKADDVSSEKDILTREKAAATDVLPNTRGERVMSVEEKLRTGLFGKILDPLGIWRRLDRR